MREKENINLKNKINFKNLLVKKTQQSFNLQSYNIQTIRKDKYQNFFYENKKFNKTKLSNNIRYLNNTNTNINISNNYLLNDDQESFPSSPNTNNTNKEPSPINSLNSSFNSTYTQKKNKYKRLQKRNNLKYNNFNINSSNSINNLSLLNSRTTNTNQSVSLNSSSSSSYNENSDSSDFSYRSRNNKRKNYKALMMAEEEESGYLKRKDVGLFSSDDEENNNSVDNNNASEENYNNEIERILIEIYNKNISIISSGNYVVDMEKNKYELEEIERQIKKYLKKKNFKINLLVLKCLSQKIKDLVIKYKEKVFEIDEIKTIYDLYKKGLIYFSNNIYHNNNSVGSNVATNSNSSYDSNFNDEEIIIKNTNNLLNIQDEIKVKEITNILLRELINIKKTLKISSKEIESIFRYPLSLLKNENGKKIKFSVELMQSEEFIKTLLHDDFINSLLFKMKEFTAQKNSDISQLIIEVEKDCDHKNEMTSFVKYINEKLGIQNENNENIENNNYLDEFKIKENINNNNLEEQIKNVVYSIDTGSSTDGNTYINDKILKNTNSISSEYEEEYINNNKNNSNKKSKKKKKKNNEEEKKIENDKINFKDIDELLNYINDETDSKKGKKRGKKCRKNKKQNNINKEKEKENEENNYLKNENNNIDEIKNFEENKDKEFEELFNDFKRDIEKNSVYVYDINKIEACLSDDFITNKCTN